MPQAARRESPRHKQRTTRVDLVFHDLDRSANASLWEKKGEIFMLNLTHSNSKVASAAWSEQLVMIQLPNIVPLPPVPTFLLHSDSNLREFSPPQGSC